MRIDPNDDYWSDSDCAERVAGAMQNLSEALLARALPDDSAALHDPALRLERHLLRGEFGDALALCRALPPERHAALFLSVIRQIEARWKADTICFSELAFAFFQLRHLIDHDAVRPLQPMAMAVSGGPRILVALAHGERHSFGAQILAADLAAQGWSVTVDLTGEGEGLKSRLAAEHFDVLALSVGHDGAMHGLADLINDLRHTSRQGRLSVVLGGAALAEPRGQYTFLGADAVTLSAAEATAWISATLAARRLHHRN